MNQIKVSIIIPVYNTEPYVADTLNCILGQTLDAIEIIVIDDGSTDNSFHVINAVARKDNRVRVYRQENMGQSVARNFGIGLAKGEYIYFMDSDDLLDKDTLHECYESSLKYTLDILFFDAVVFGSIKNNLTLNYLRCHRLKEGTYTGKEVLDMLLKTDGYSPSPCLNFVRTAYLSRINLHFHPGIIHEDELFTFLLFIQAERVGFINKPYFKRRLRENSTMSTQFSRKNLTGYFTVVDKLTEFKRVSNDNASKALVDLRLKLMLNSLLFNSRSLKFSERYFILFHCLYHYPHYLTLKNVVLLIFPSVQLLKKLRKKNQI